VHPSINQNYVAGCNNWKSATVVSLAVLVFIWFQLTALLATTSLNGESAILSNVVIEYVRTGKWHYPVHAQHLFYPGIETFMIHPPLHYWITSLWVKLFGIGVWQLHLQSMLSGIIGIAAGTYVMWRNYGVHVALFVPILAAVHGGFYFSSLQLRPEMTLGLGYGLTVLVFGVLILRPQLRLNELLLAFALGLLAAACLATHWYGYFVQLYLVVYAFRMLLQRRRDAWEPIAFCAAGWLMVMGTWYVAVGKDLLPSLIVVLIKGNEFRSILDIPIPHALMFITDWPGGYELLGGVVLAFMYGCYEFIVSFWKQRPLTTTARVVWFLFINLAAYALFFVIFVGNKHPRYASNIYFLCIPLAAIGFGSWIRHSVERFPRKALVPVIACGVAVLILLQSPIVKVFAQGVPMNSLHPNSAFRDTCRAFDYLIPKDESVIVGGNAYPYLYDRTYESTMLFVARHALRDPGPLSLLEMISYYRDMPGKNYRSLPFPIEKRREQLKNSQSNYMVLSDLGSSWQWLFYDRAVWLNDFIEVGFVVPTHSQPHLSKLFPYYASATYPIGYLVFVRRSSLSRLQHERLWPLIEDYPRLLSVGEDIVIATAGGKDRHGFLFGDDWKVLNESERRAKLEAYLESIAWYGATLDAGGKQAICSSIFPYVDSYFARIHGSKFNEIIQGRTLANAVDHGFALIGYPASFPRVPESEWNSP